MARPLRIEFAGALYHVTSRGDRREAICDDDEDRAAFLDVLSEVIKRYNWICHAYCLMTNHYHLVIETVDGNLSQGMRQLNGVYTQASNRRHQRVGHLFQGRFKGILVDEDAYLTELSRYVVLNPVRAGMVKAVAEWHWSSYRSMIGEVPVPAWLSVDRLLGQFGDTRKAAQRRYRSFVEEGTGVHIWEGLRQQMYLGDEKFVGRMQAHAKVEGDLLSFPKIQRRRPTASVQEIAAGFTNRDAAVISAYVTGAYSYREIAEHFGVHPSTIGRIVRKEIQRAEK